jgi:hypothetical protein
MKHNGLRVGNPLLNQYYPVGPNVLLDVYVRAGNHQGVRPILSLVVDEEAMILQIPPTASHHRVTCDIEPQMKKILFLIRAIHRRLLQALTIK